MHENRELKALFTLLDDPDESVFNSVSNRIVEYGKPIIPNLEHLWEITPNEEVQERIEMLIHRLQFSDVLQDFAEWKSRPYHDLLLGTLLVAKCHYPDLHTAPVYQDIEKMRRTIWLELNNYLTPLEQIHVIGSIIFKYFQFQSQENNHDQHDHFFINKVLTSKKGNGLLIGIIVQLMCELLDIPARLIPIPGQVILAIPDAHSEAISAQQQILFFVDGANGQAYSHKDIEEYLLRISCVPEDRYFTPMSNLQIIEQLLKETAECFNHPNQLYKKDELIQIARLLSN